MVVVGADIGQHNMERLRERFPEIEFVLAVDRESILAVVEDAEVLFAKGVPSEVWTRAKRLRWYQAGMAGVDSVIPLVADRPDLIVTNASGAHGEVISELILAMMLSFATGLHYLERRCGAEPAADERESIMRGKFSLRGQTVGILGLGDIGGTLAKKLRALGVTTVGITRTGTRSNLVDSHYPVENLHAALPGLDHLALCLPLTAATHRIIGAAELTLMKRGAYLYNVGRGGSVDPDALVDALETGRLAGAGLDVTEPEPLPASSRLRTLPQVILSEHTSGSSPENSDLITTIFIDNLTRYLSGRPLENLVDRRRGY
jgi:D-2-hydroxyacid dehydrogenase (NADP+)